MRRLGYERYGAQGGDAGAFIAPDMGRIDPRTCVGVHVNALVQIPSLPQILCGLATFSKAERRRFGAVQALPRRHDGLCADSGHAAQDAGLRADRFAGRAAGLDRREVQGVDRSGSGAAGATPSLATVSSTTSACTGSPARRDRRPTSTTRSLHDPPPARASPGTPSDRRGRLLDPGRDHPALGRAREQHRALDRVQTRRPLRRTGSPGLSRHGCAGILSSPSRAA